eukprot:UC1_evm1s2034
MADANVVASSGDKAVRRKASDDARGAGGGNSGGSNKRPRKGAVAHSRPGPDASPTQHQFYNYAQALTAKQDRRERLVKMSRDVTIASKRTIFLLHRIEGDNREAKIEEARAELTAVRAIIKNIAKEVNDVGVYQFARAYSPGLQEYVEAATFLAFCADGTLIARDVLNADLVFGGEDDGGGDLKFVISPADYMLGVADLTGECMRMCINALGRDEETPSKICAFMRRVFDGFNALPPN